MNSYLAPKISSFCAANLANSAIAYMDVGKGREQDAEALAAIRDSPRRLLLVNLNILNHNLLRSE